MNIKHRFKRFMLLLLTMVITPIQVFAYSDYIIASGENIGIELHSNGIIIVGTYEVSGVSPADDANLQNGDKITAINNTEVNSIDEMLEVIDSATDISKLDITYLRGSKELNTTLNLINDENGVYKTGLYVKDSVNGVGTLTFIDPKTKFYGALGHEIVEKTTGQKLEIKDGKIFNSTVTSITPSDERNPGEKNARYDVNDVYGNVKENTSSGIFGVYTDELPDSKLYKVAGYEEIELGKAQLLTVVSGNSVEAFDINILKISNNADSAKNILFEVTDQNLLDISGGIVQGMSGSPIIQGDNIIGCVTHVVVDDPTKGYGILITSMLEEAEN